jgi:hypothetical protein
LEISLFWRCASLSTTAPPQQLAICERITRRRIWKCEWLIGAQRMRFDSFEMCSCLVLCCVTFCSNEHSKMKKLINDPHNVVPEMLVLNLHFSVDCFFVVVLQSSLSCSRSQEGLVQIQPNVRLISEHKILIRADIETIRSKQVTLISGGGSFWNKF